MTQYSDQTLEATPERVTKFLCGVAAVPMIRTALGIDGGMTKDDIDEGRELLFAVLSSPRPEAPEEDTPKAEEIRRLIVELDAWDEPNFAIAKASLTRHFPDVAGYVFKDLAPAKGTDAVTGVATFLTRIDALEEGTDPARVGTREQDREAVELLAKRKITPEVRRDLRAKIDRVLGPTPSLSIPEVDADARREALSALKGWHDEWSTIARKVVTKRSHLIRLGLASRRSPKSRGESDGSGGGGGLPE